MPILYHVALCDDEVGEVEGFFDESGSLLASWCLNDANWRGEYQNSLLNSLGYNVYFSDSEELEQKLKASWLGYI